MGLVNTRMQSLRTRYARRLDKNELRPSRYGVLEAFQRDSMLPSGILDAEVKATIKRSFGNSVVIPVLNAETVAIGNTRSCTVAASENTSALVTLTFVTYAWGFTMYPARHMNNDVSYQQDFDRKFEKYLLQFAATLDTAAFNALNTAKNAYFPADITNIYEVVGNALQVGAGSQDNFYNMMASILETMDFYGGYNSVGNTMHQAAVRKFQNQGSANQNNLAFQFMGYNFGFSNRITNGDGVASTVFLMPEGTVAMENRNDPDSIAGSKSSSGVTWEEVELPLVNMKVGSKHYSSCADVATALGGEDTAGLTASMLEGYQWSTDVCFVTAYNSDSAARYSPIVKAEFLTI